MKIVKAIKKALGVKEEHGGLTASELTLVELKELCKQNNLDIKGLSTKSEILKVVRKWEKKMLKDMEEQVKARGATLGKNPVTPLGKEIEVALKLHEGQRVVSTVHRGNYTDITVEKGITYRVPKLK